MNMNEAVNLFRPATYSLYHSELELLVMDEMIAQELDPTNQEDVAKFWSTKLDVIRND